MKEKDRNNHFLCLMVRFLAQFHNLGDHDSFSVLAIRAEAMCSVADFSIRDDQV